jgi:hypothetical protein
MDADFPAAHSMDTDWFAVDRDGHVGYFDTNEPGAVPTLIYHGGAPGFDLFDVLLETATVGAPLDDLRGWLHPGPLRQTAPHWQPSSPDLNGQVRMYLKSLEPVRALIEQGQASVQLAREGHAVLIQEPEAALLQTLHGRQLCLACFRQYWGDQVMSHAAALGCFVYHCQGYARPNNQFGVTAPYGRKKLPEFPVHVDQLPPEARAYVKRFRFETCCFAETLYIQPAEHVECSSWDELAFLSSDGTRIITQRPESKDYRRYCEMVASFGLPAGLSIQALTRQT